MADFVTHVKERALLFYHDNYSVFLAPEVFLSA